MPAPWSSWTRWAPTPPFLPFNGWSKKGQGAYGSVPRNRGKNTTLLSSMTIEGMGPSLAVEGATDTKVFETYVERVLAPRLREGQVVVMDNLSAHKGERVRELIEQRGCELLYLPSYSPDFNPIEEAFGKMKGFLRRVEARSREALRKKPSGRRSRRLAIETPVGSSSTAATVQRFNRFDHSCIERKERKPREDDLPEAYALLLLAVIVGWLVTYLLTNQEMDRYESPRRWSDRTRLGSPRRSRGRHRRLRIARSRCPPRRLGHQQCRLPHQQRWCHYPGRQLFHRCRRHRSPRPCLRPGTSRRDPLARARCRCPRRHTSGLYHQSPLWCRRQADRRGYPDRRFH